MAIYSAFSGYGNQTNLYKDYYMGAYLLIDVITFDTQNMSSMFFLANNTMVTTANKSTDYNLVVYFSQTVSIGY